MFSLPPAAQEVLRQYKAGMLVPQVLADLTDDEVQELHHAEREFDAKEHAEWAGKQLGELLKRQYGDKAEEHLIGPDRRLSAWKLWAYNMLERRYLVQRDWRKHAYETALKFVRAR